MIEVPNVRCASPHVVRETCQGDNGIFGKKIIFHYPITRRFILVQLS